jgi:hypothetical protein
MNEVFLEEALCCALYTFNLNVYRSATENFVLDNNPNLVYNIV